MRKLEAIQQLIQTAKTEIGTREIGNTNTGKRVQEYQSATTLGGTGWPWCAAFIAWCMVYALGKELARLVWILSASCYQILNWARSSGITVENPEPGDIGLVMAGDHNATHIFLITSVDKNVGKMTTVEGNTNNDGSREGNGVYERTTRRINGDYTYVRWSNLLPNTDEWSIYASDGHLMGKRIAIEGRVYIEARVWGAWFGLETSWNNDTQQVLYNNIPVHAQIRKIDGVAWLPIRALAHNQGLGIIVDNAQRSITLQRESGGA